MVIGLAVTGLAVPVLAAPVVCDPAAAARLVVDANIAPERVPVTHPWLVPGLARSAGDTATAAAVRSECEAGGELVVQRADQYDGAGWAAYVVVLSRVERDGCNLIHHRVPISVGIVDDDPIYRIRGSLPPERTPIASCPDPPVWREHRVIAGENSAVRLILVVDHEGDRVTHTHVLVRTADPTGWSDQVLLDPAPPRLLDPAAAGPVVRLARTADGTTLVVASGDRSPPPCRALGGQTVWVRDEQDRWVAHRGRDALTLLSSHGLWRYAGDDGWLLILALDDEDDEDLMRPRMARLQRRDDEPLYMVKSADFPGLYAGYLVVAPGPWPTEAEAKQARGRWKRSALAYVKVAWRAPDPCGP